MSVVPVRVNPVGGLNKDSDPQYIQGGDYIDAKNIRPVSNDGSTTGRLETILGNEKVFEIPTVTAQEKWYRLFVVANASLSYQATFKTVNGATIATASFAGDATLSTAVGNAETAIEAAITGAGLTHTVTPNTTDGYVDIKIQYSSGYAHDWKLTSTGTDDFVYYVLSEAIDASIAGTPSVIGSYDLLGNLFIFSTPKTEKPSQVTISEVVLVNGGTATITTSTAHGLSSGEYVNINTPGIATTHGKFLVTVTSTTEFTLDAVVPASSSTTANPGSLTKDLSGYGIIGVATKDMAGTWEYKQLIAAKALNFVTLNQIDSKLEKDALKTSFYFTDDYNPARSMYYTGSYIANGFMEVENSENIYIYDNLDLQTRLIQGEPNISMTVSQENTGGYLTAGNKRYSTRLLTDSFDPTSWSYLTNPIPVVDDTYGTIAGTDTTKYHEITVTGIPDNTYKYIELAVVEYAGTAISGYIVRRDNLPSSIPATGVIVRHYGNETETQTLDLGTLAVTSGTVLTAQNIEALDNRLVLSNLTVAFDYDLTEWAQDITYSLGKSTFNGLGYLNSTIDLGAEYYNDGYCTNFVGYMDNETYRFGIQVKWINGGWSKAYHIDDITFDTTTAGRKTGLAHYNLTATSTGDPYVTNVTFTNVDLDFALSDGSLLRDKIEAFRIVRAECVPEIMFTGFMILGNDRGAGTYQPNDEYSNSVGGAYGGTASERGIAKIMSYDLYLNKVTGIEKGVYDVNYYRSGDQILSHGNPERINTYVKTAATEQIVEYNGFFDGTVSTFTVNTDSAKWANDSIVVNGKTWANTLTDFPGMVVAGTAQFTDSGGNTDYGIYYVQYKRAQTNKYGDVENTQYITTGHIEIDLSSITTASTFVVYGGDTFTQKTFVTTEGDNLTPRNYAIGAYTQNRSNAQLRIITVAGSNTMLPNPTNGVTTLAKDNYLTFGENSYSQTSFDIKNSIQTYQGFDVNLPETGDAPSRIIYSSVKAQGSVKDSYRIFLPLNFKDLPLGNGEIVHMAVGNGELLTWQPRSFMRQYFNSRGILQTGDGTEVLIGSGSVLDRDGVQLSQFGTKHKWGVVKGKSAGGKDTFYWLNSEYGKLLRFGYDGTVALSDIKGMMSFFNDSLVQVDHHTTPAHDYGICGVFHNRFGEAIFTVRALYENEAWVTATSYSVNDGAYISGNNAMTFEGFPQIYICKKAHTSGASNKPETGASWQTYWIKCDPSSYDYSAIYTIVFSEIKNKVTSFYTPRPKIYLPFKGGYLSPHPTTSNYVYEHNRGNYCRWYETTSVNGGQDITFTAGSTTVVGTSTSFQSDMVNSGVVTYYVSDGTNYYEVVTVTDQTHIEVYPTPDTSITSGDYVVYRTNSEDAYVEMVTNYDPNTSKHWIAQQFNTEVVPYRLDHTTENHVSYIEEEDFETRENFHYTTIKNDTLTGGGLNDADSSQLYGKWLKTKVTFKKNIYNSIYNFITKCLLKSRLYNK